MAFLDCKSCKRLVVLRSKSWVSLWKSLKTFPTWELLYPSWNNKWHFILNFFQRMRSRRPYADKLVVFFWHRRCSSSHNNLITYWFGVHQFWQFWRYCIYCYLSWYSTCFTYIDIAISPCATLICTYFDFLDIVVYLPKALLICYLFFIFWLEGLPLFW